MLCHLFWSVARKAQHICSLVWASSRRWTAGREPLKGALMHRVLDTLEQDLQEERLERDIRQCGWEENPCCLPFSSPFSSLVSALHWSGIKCPSRPSPLFAVFPLMNFGFCHKLIHSLAWMKIQSMLCLKEKASCPLVHDLFILKLILHKKVNKRAQGWM